MVNSPHYESDPTEEWKEEEGRFVLKPRGFDVMWGNHRSYWDIPQPSKRDDPAHLLAVWSLELHASKKIDPKKSYQIGFTVSLRNEWGPDPIFIMAKRGTNGNLLARRVYLSGYKLDEKFDIPENFVVRFEKGDSSEPIIHIHLYDHWTPHWKYDLSIHHAFVKEIKDDKR